MTAFSTVGLVVRQQDHSVADTLKDIHALLERKGCVTRFEHGTDGMVDGVETVGFDTIGEQCDLAIVIGGDGTLLSAARDLVDFGVPLVGVNRGRLGFLTDVHPDENLLQLAAILEGDYVPDERLMLRMDVERDGEVMSTDSAFNDVVIRNTQMLRIVDFEVYIDGSFVNHQRADGIIVSTPSGSTAYSLLHYRDRGLRRRRAQRAGRVRRTALPPCATRRHRAGAAQAATPDPAAPERLRLLPDTSSKIELALTHMACRARPRRRQPLHLAPCCQPRRSLTRLHQRPQCHHAHLERTR